MTDISEKHPASLAGDDRSMPGVASSVSRGEPRGILQYAGYALAFLSGCLLTVAVHYMLRGTGLQLNPESFVSLVFTIAVGAASLVLAIVAINYGRISETVMTDRADRSIDIQMSLFQKSIDLQTQLFDKTMSTLESIGRSTGVTEQRLSDIHSLMQNPTMLKQIAGRAVEQTTSELSKGGKEIEKREQFEPELVERLTKNIVGQLSARLEGLGSAAPVARVSRTQSPGEPQSGEANLLDSIDKLKRQLELSKRRETLRAAIQTAASAIPGATLQRAPTDAIRFWDYVVDYKGKKLAVDMRTLGVLGDGSLYTDSIQQLATHSDTQYLLFLFAEPPSKGLSDYLDLVKDAFPGKIHVVATMDPKSLELELRAILDRLSAASIHPIRQGSA